MTNPKSFDNRCFSEHWNPSMHSASDSMSNPFKTSLTVVNDALDSITSFLIVILRYFRDRRSSTIWARFAFRSPPIYVFCRRPRIVRWIAATLDLRSDRFRERISFKMPFRTLTVRDRVSQRISDCASQNVQNTECIHWVTEWVSDWVYRYVPSVIFTLYWSPLRFRESSLVPLILADSNCAEYDE